MRSSVLALLVACRASSSPSAGPAPIASDEVATPTASPPQQAAAPPMQQAAAPPSDFPTTCKAIADELEQLGRHYPQMKDFRAADQRDCTISYKYKTHAPTRRGGWRSGVPQPDPDGIWFYLDIYAPDAPETQIHTQPVVPNWWMGSRKVMFLILEGDKTTPAGGAIMKILQRHGLVTR